MTLLPYPDLRERVTGEARPADASAEEHLSGPAGGVGGEDMPSVFDMFSIGIGPSSSHTVGPMRAAADFVSVLATTGVLGEVRNVRAELFGSLAATGIGHGTDRAVVLGLAGYRPETVDPDLTEARIEEIRTRAALALGGTHRVPFVWERDLLLHLGRNLPAHPNGMTFTAFDGEGCVLHTWTAYSVGGGFVRGAEEYERAVPKAAAGDATGRDTAGPVPTRPDPDRRTEVSELAGDGPETGHVGPGPAGASAVPYPFRTAEELLAICMAEGLDVAEVVLANECALRPEDEVREGILRIRSAMEECVRAGCARTEPLLPGRLRVPRRAPRLHADLLAHHDEDDPTAVLDWVNLYALAVNEENASGGRIVTAPTNGAAGIIPAVLHYFTVFVAPRLIGADEDGAGEGGAALDDAVVRFFLTATAIGHLVKRNASISGAEVGCQGEVGSACAMAAAGLCAVLGGTPAQVENAAEIGIEHNLGLTCDPVGGLVQIPCIERNAIAATKAVNAARMALRGDGTHHVSLDTVIDTLRRTGADMQDEYKETSRGGLAVTVVEC